jgi:ribosomal-protein-alanine N-acetyltransferase
VIGGVGFFGPPRDGRVEIGYGIVESRRRRGYATEAVTAMLDYAFARPGVIEVVATADLDNPASIRVLDKSGLSYQSQDEARVTYLITAR